MLKTSCSAEEGRPQHAALFYSGHWYREWSRGLSVIKDMGLHTIVELPFHQDESVWASKLSHNFPQSITTDSLKGLGKVDKGSVEVSILFWSVEDGIKVLCPPLQDLGFSRSALFRHRCPIPRRGHHTNVKTKNKALPTNRWSAIS